MKLNIFTVFPKLLLAVSAVFAISAVFAVSAQNTVHAAVSDPAPLEVGIGVTEITPPLSYPMAGYYSKRLSDGVLDPLMLRAFCFKQGDEMCVLTISDSIYVYDDVTAEVKRRIQEKTGLSADAVFLVGTHTHTGPVWMKYDRKITPEENLAAAARNDHEAFNYKAFWVEQTEKAILESMKNVRPASLSIGKTSVTDLSFNRRYFMKDSDQVRFNPGVLNPNIIRPAGPIDPDLFGILFRDAEKKPFASLSNFALHLDTTGGTKFSADYPFYIQTVLREKFGTDFISGFGIGTCGDINHVDVTNRHRRRAPEIGTELGKRLAALYDGELSELSPSLDSAMRTLTVKRQEFTEEQIARARELRKEVMNTSSQLTFLERVEVGKIVNLSTLPLEHQVEVGAIRLSSDTAIVLLPGEIFVELGQDLKRRSPFKNTIIIELSQTNAKYIPTRKAFQEGSYETINVLFPEGTGERFIDAAMECLEELKK
ncbi:MAG: neutral/alkaline non-lysosomal ceramidase N-terminal domain-containing protein [Thermoguttaceae bacterium]|nr:neutral/alkaline non-lysosomal ceramidase N-terminal domain-containing protein [Thermoguttaceae bacterium]